MALRFNPPPNWPAPPEGFVPPAGWQPDPAWGPAPEGWELWVDDSTSAASAPVAPSANDAAWAPTQAVPTGQSAPVASPTGQPAAAPSGTSAPVAASAASASPYAGSMSYAQSPTPYHNQGQAASAPQQGGWQPIDVAAGKAGGGSQPITKKWWFWLVIGLVALLVLIGIVVAVLSGGDDESGKSDTGSAVGTAAPADPTSAAGSASKASDSATSASKDEQGMTMSNPADPATQTLKIKANKYATDPEATIEVQFGAVEWDATGTIKKAYEDQDYASGFKDPGSDKVYMRVPVTITYHGKGQMNSFDVKVDYVKDGNTTEATWDTALLDDEFSSQDMPRDGGKVTGYFTYVIPKSDEKSGVFAVTGLSNYDEEMYMAAK